MWLFTAAYTQIRLDATVLVLYKQRHLATPILGTRAHVPSKVWAGGDVFLYPLNMEWWLGICLSNYSSNMFLLSNQLWLINLTKCRNFELKCTKMRYATSLRPNPPREKRFPDHRLSKEGDKGGGSCFTAREPIGGKGPGEREGMWMSPPMLEADRGHCVRRKNYSRPL